MKLVLAYVNPYRVDDIVEAIKSAEISGLTVVEAQGFGRQAGHQEIYRGAEYEVDLVQKVRIEILIDDTMAPETMSMIEEVVHTGSIGDGKILILDVEDVVRIRTGERGEDAV